MGLQPAETIRLPNGLLWGQPLPKGEVTRMGRLVQMGEEAFRRAHRD